MDLDIFFSGLDERIVTFEMQEGGRCEIVAYFDNAFYDSSIGETVLDTTRPRLTCKYTDVHNILRETIVNINDKKFSVTQIQPDGNGLATVFLAHE